MYSRSYYSSTKYERAEWKMPSTTFTKHYKELFACVS